MRERAFMYILDVAAADPLTFAMHWLKLTSFSKSWMLALRTMAPMATIGKIQGVLKDCKLGN